MSRLDYHYFRQGQRNADKYDDDTLLQMLDGEYFEDIYEAMGAISKKKLKSALERLKSMALYEDDIALQEEAVRTIRRICGRKALDILRFLKTTNHKELIDYILKYGVDA